jgi:hypothetical protein
VTVAASGINAKYTVKLVGKMTDDTNMVFYTYNESFSIDFRNDSTLRPTFTFPSL